MPTANEQIRDALIRHQIALIRANEKIAAEIVALLSDAHADLRGRLNQRLQRIIEQGADATKRLLALEEEIRSILQVPHRKLDEQVREYLADVATREPVFVKEDHPGRAAGDRELHAAASAAAARDRAAQPDRRLRLERLDQQARGGRSRPGNGQRPSRPGARREHQDDRFQDPQGQRVHQAWCRAPGAHRQHHHRQPGARRVLPGQRQPDCRRGLVATLDSRTCPQCGVLDGKRYKVGEGPMPAVHGNCRCCRVPSLDGSLLGTRPTKSATEKDLLAEYAEQEGLDPVSSRARLPRGHKTKFDEFSRTRIRELIGSVPASERFRDFLGKQTRAFQEDVLGIERARLFREGKLELEDFVDATGRLHPMMS